MLVIERVLLLRVLLVKYLLNLNIYTTIDEDSREYRLDCIVATRVYVILLIASMFSLIGYTAFSHQQFVVRVENPLLNEYEHLQAIYSDTLSCSCSQISIPLSTFITIDTTFHQVCST